MSIKLLNARLYKCKLIKDFKLGINKEIKQKKQEK